MRIYPKDIRNKEVQKLLWEEVLLCHAPVTGIFVASAIFTEKAVYFEHNYERQDPVFFEHSETRSLANILQKEKNPKIRKIMFAAGGNANKFKSYIPCYSCSMAMHLYAQKDATVQLLELPNVNKRLVFPFGELLECYKALPYSKINGTDFINIRKELIQKTPLFQKDLDFVAELTMFGKEKSIGIYLTGSCCGRGGAGTFLNSKTRDKYRDIDVCVILAKENYPEFQKYLEDLIEKHYGQFVKNDKNVPSQHNPKGVVFKKTNYYCGIDKETTLDFTFSVNFEGTLAYHAYETKNWFHRLS